MLAEAELHPQVRLFFEELVRERPGEDIRILAARRSRESTEEGRERLTAPCGSSCEALALLRVALYLFRCL